MKRSAFLGTIAIALLAPGAEAAGPLVPSALTWGPSPHLRVALRDARQVVAVDPKTWKVVGVRDLKFPPVALAVADDRATLLIGGEGGEFAALDAAGAVVSELPPGKGPATVLALPDGRAAVAGLWDEAVRIVDWKRGTVVAVHPLSIAPRALALRPDGRVVAADAFQGRLADFLPGVAGSERTREFDGVNLHALAFSGDGRELLVGHLAQYDAVPISVSNIDWGLVISSRLSAVRLTDFDRPQGPETTLPRRRLTLDGTGHGAADPSALAVTPDGTKVVMALAGAHQVLVNDRTLGAPSPNAPDLLPIGHAQRLDVVEVGRSPIALVLDPSGTIAVTADSMSDTLTVVRVADLSIVTTVALSDSEPERTAAHRGEALFGDGRLGRDRWMSCASCHPLGHANGLNFDTFGDGTYGAAKNTPSLLGVAPTAPFSWTGRFANLTAQIHQSLTTSLRGPGATDEVVIADLAAYLRTLAPPPARRPDLDPAAQRGVHVFQRRKCQTCHEPPLYTTPELRDVGLDDGPGGHSRFNPPSLRGVARSAPYLHDGQAADLNQLLELHAPGHPGSLSDGDRDDLRAFLESL